MGTDRRGPYPPQMSRMSPHLGAIEPETVERSLMRRQTLHSENTNMEKTLDRMKAFILCHNKYMLGATY